MFKKKRDSLGEDYPWTFTVDIPTEYQQINAYGDKILEISITFWEKQPLRFLMSIFDKAGYSYKVTIRENRVVSDSKNV